MTEHEERLAELTRQREARQDPGNEHSFDPLYHCAGCGRTAEEIRCGWSAGETARKARGSARHHAVGRATFLHFLGDEEGRDAALAEYDRLSPNIARPE